jgi:hypothetical protein
MYFCVAVYKIVSYHYDSEYQKDTTLWGVANLQIHFTQLTQVEFIKNILIDSIYKYKIYLYARTPSFLIIDSIILYSILSNPFKLFYEIPADILHCSDF